MADRRIVIVGAGIAGTGLADELTMRGEADVTVLDQGPLFKTGGATSHAPGLMTRTSPSHMMLGLADYTIEKLLGLSLGELPCFLPVGAIEIATTLDRWSYLQRRVEFAQAWGFSAELIEPAQAAELHPLLDASKILGGMHTTREGIGKALRGAQVQGERAQSAGARVIDQCRVERVVTEGGRVVGVDTSLGRFDADIVVLAAGSWGKGLALSAGVSLPMVAMEHQYAITTPLEMLEEHATSDASLPFIRHWDGGVYMRNEGAAIGIGSFNHKALPLSDDVMVEGNERRLDPSIFEFTQEDWDPAWREVVEVMPALDGVELPVTYNGVFPYSPDGLPLLGPAPEVEGLWVLECVWATHAVGAARSIAEMLCGDEPTVDISTADIARFDGPELAPAHFEPKCDISYADTYAIHHPAEGSSGPRGVRRSPFFAVQEHMGAAFFDTSAWERPRWYEQNRDLVEAVELPERDTWSSMHWSPICAAEHLAVRSSVGVFDMTSLRRIFVTGSDACAFLSRVTTRNMDVTVGAVVYALMLTPQGRIVSDVTVTRLSETEYLVGGNSARDVQWLHAQRSDFDVHIDDRTSGTCCIGLWGPTARDVMADLTSSDVPNDAMRYYTSAQIDVAGVPVIASRVSYVGEMGWEIVTGADTGAHLWEQVAATAAEHGGIVAGRGALSSLRTEKGYRAWGTDMTRADTPEEAGLGFAVRGDDHIGVQAAAAATPRRRLRTLAIDRPDVIPMFGNPVFNGDAVVGSVTSADYGWSVGHPIAYAWLPVSADEGDTFTVSSGGHLLPAHVVGDCVYDSSGSRMRS